VRRALLSALGIVLPARAAEACATCITSPFGDQTYNWAYLGLILAPFALGAVIAAVLAGCWLAARRREPARAPADSLTREETT
jgi:hypothetical protein